MRRGPPTLPPNRAIILIGLVVENPLVVEDAIFAWQSTPATDVPHHTSQVSTSQPSHSPMNDGRMQRRRAD